ncbi:PIN domain-containing protein [Bdellovibrionota bacterium FG-2]
MKTTMKPVLLDTSGIVALLDSSEQYHPACAEVLMGLRRPLITCEAVIAESCHLLRRMHGASEMLLKNIQTGIIRMPWRLVGRDLRIAELMHQYTKVPMSFADACLVCIYRWSSRKTFNMLITLKK